MGVEAQRVKQANRVAVARKIRLGEDRFCWFCRSIKALTPQASRRVVEFLFERHDEMVDVGVSQPVGQGLHRNTAF